MLDFSGVFRSHFYSLALSWMATRHQLCQLLVDWSHGACGWLGVQGCLRTSMCVHMCRHEAKQTMPNRDGNVL